MEDSLSSNPTVVKSAKEDSIPKCNTGKGLLLPPISAHLRKPAKSQLTPLRSSAPFVATNNGLTKSGGMDVHGGGDNRGGESGSSG